MEGSEIRLKKIHPNAELPKRATSGSSGFDLKSVEDADIPSGGWSVIRTGLVMEMRTGLEAQIRSRSGLAAKKGLFVLNSPGTIDSDYRGEICVILANISKETGHIKRGDRIAQMVISRVEQPVFELVSELEDTQRGEGGFGSTGTD
ncbi:MAG TPA: dUTP diphosphatase [Euryarchaeota archaeon]|nr:dUTP diphosphatase [Euryarchaeota archaeon]